MSKLIEALQFYRDGWDATTGDPTDALLADKGDMAMSALESDHAAAIQAARGALDSQVLRDLLGAIEDSGTPEAAKLWAMVEMWEDHRQLAIRLLAGEEATK